MKKSYLLPAVAIALAGCGSDSYEFDSDWHISAERVAEESPKAPSGIPNLVGTTAALPELEYGGPSDLYDVVVDNADLRLVLNQIADQAQLNLDIDPFVAGVISLNAYGQTVDQLLERIRAQSPLRFERVGNSLVILRDDPYFKQYTIDYPNIARTWSSSSDAGLSTSGSSSLGSSSISTSQEGSGSFWAILDEAVTAILDESGYEGDIVITSPPVGEGEGADAAQETADFLVETGESEPQRETDSFANSIPEAGLMIVYADAGQHEQIAQLIGTYTSAAKRQVQLQATVVEVQLNNDYKQGIDWSLFNAYSNSPRFVQGGAGGFGPILRDPLAGLDPYAGERIRRNQALADYVTAGSFLRGTVSVDTSLEVTEDRTSTQIARDFAEWADDNGYGDVSRAGAVQILAEEDITFDDADTLARDAYNDALGLGYGQPAVTGDGFLTGTFRIGTLQAAVSLLDEFGDTRVVSSPRVSTLNGQGALLKVVEDRIYFSIEQTLTTDEGVTTLATTIDEETIPVGFAMNVFPQISAEGTIILVLRPSLTRVVGVANAPRVTGSAIAQAVPIISVKEIESIILLNNGETAVLGGLIEDLQADSDTQVPGLGDLPGLGNLFKKVNQATRRVEYVIFVTAQVITNPSIHGDYSDYQQYLPSDELFHRDNSGTIFGSGRTLGVPRNR